MHENIYFKEAKKVTFIGILINIFLVVIKLVVGLFGKSSALIADGIHSFSDLSSDIIVLWGLKFGSKPSDERHKYGHGKYETFANFILGVFLVFAGVEIFYISIKKLILFSKKNTLPVPEWMAFVVAFASVVFKGIIYLYTVRVGKRIKSNLLISNAYHHLSDSVSSVGVMIGILGAKILPSNWVFLDPLAALILSILILKVAIEIIKESFDELVEKSLDKKEEEKIIGIISSVEGVFNPHKLRTRKIGNWVAIDVHIRVKRGLSIEKAHEISTIVEKKLREKYRENIITNIHIEPCE